MQPTVNTALTILLRGGRKQFKRRRTEYPVSVGVNFKYTATSSSSSLIIIGESSNEKLQICVSAYSCTVFVARPRQKLSGVGLVWCPFLTLSASHVQGMHVVPNY